MPYPRSVFQRSGLERPESPSLPSPFVSRHSNRLSWLPLGRRTHETPPRGLRVLRTFLSLFPSPALSRPSVLHLALPLLSSTPVGVFVLVLSVIASQSSARQRSFYLVDHAYVTMYLYLLSRAEACGFSGPARSKPPSPRKPNIFINTMLVNALVASLGLVFVAQAATVPHGRFARVQRRHMRREVPQVGGLALKLRDASSDPARLCRSTPTSSS